MLEPEYGSVGNVRFINPDCVKMYDGNGSIMMCKCGKPAGSGAFGKDAYIAWCEECAPVPKYEANFIYRKHK